MCVCVCVLLQEFVTENHNASACPLITVHIYASAIHIHTIVVHMYAGKDYQLFTGFVTFQNLFVLKKGISKLKI